MAKKTKDKEHSFASRVYAPYANAIGQLVLVWNDLHEKLGLLFMVLMLSAYLPERRKSIAKGEQLEGDSDSWQIDRSISVWGSPHYDRPKRDMLSAILESCETQFDQNFPTFKEDIKWILDRCNDIEEIRNNAVHSPLEYTDHNPILAKITGNKGVVTANVRLRNKRAVKLTKYPRGFLEEFRWARDASSVLSKFTENITFCVLSDGMIPWPDKPSLPNRGQKTTPRKQQRRLPDK